MPPSQVKASQPDTWCRWLGWQPFWFAYAIALRPTSTAADIDVIQNIKPKKIKNERNGVGGENDPKTSQKTQRRR